MPSPTNTLSKLLRDHQAQLLADWIAQQQQSLASRRDLISDADLARQSGQFLELFIEAMESSDPERPHGAAWDTPPRDAERPGVSRARARVLTQRDGDVRVFAEAAGVRR